MYYSQCVSISRECIAFSLQNTFFVLGNVRCRWTTPCQGSPACRRTATKPSACWATACRPQGSCSNRPGAGAWALCCSSMVRNPFSFAALLHSKHLAACPGMHQAVAADTVTACSWSHVSFGDTQQSHGKAAAYPYYTGLVANDPFAWAPPCLIAVVLVLNMDISTTLARTHARWAVHGTRQKSLCRVDL